MKQKTKQGNANQEDGCVENPNGGWQRERKVESLMMVGYWDLDRNVDPVNFFFFKGEKIQNCCLEIEWLLGSANQLEY